MARLKDENDLSSLTVATTLRKQYPADLVAFCMTLTELRRAGREKFGERADSMLLTRDGLEQATRMSIARHHAAVFREAGIATVREVGPGIGGDTLAMAEAGLTVDAVELDEERVEMVRVNLAGYDSVTVRCGDGLTNIDAEGLWADPARRGPAGRISNPEHWAPPLSAIVAAAQRVRLAGIKVAPGIDYRYLPPAQVEWISDGGDLVEAVIWIGRGAPARRAIIAGGPQLTIDTPPSAPPAQVEPRQLQGYLYEPDPALIRAGGISHLCSSLDLAPVAPNIAYLTGERVCSPWLTRFEILEVLPLKSGPVRRYLAEHGVGSVEVKKRGVDVSPERFRASLRLSGPGSATVVLTPTLAGRRALHVHREAD